MNDGAESPRRQAPPPLFPAELLWNVQSVITGDDVLSQKAPPPNRDAVFQSKSQSISVGEELS